MLHPGASAVCTRALVAALRQSWRAEMESERWQTGAGGGCLLGRLLCGRCSAGDVAVPIHAKAAGQPTDRYEMTCPLSNVINGCFEESRYLDMCCKGIGVLLFVTDSSDPIMPKLLGSPGSHRRRWNFPEPILHYNRAGCGAVTSPQLQKPFGEACYGFWQGGDFIENAEPQGNQCFANE